MRLCDCDCVWPWRLLGLVHPLLQDDWLHALPPDQPLQLLQPPKLPLLHGLDLLRDWDWSLLPATLPAVHVAPLGALFLYLVRLCDCVSIWPSRWLPHPGVHAVLPEGYEPTHPAQS